MKLTSEEILPLFSVQKEDGITSDLMNMSDIKARIPMKGEIASLNVGVSVGMALYERMRQLINA